MIEKVQNDFLLRKKVEQLFVYRDFPKYQDFCRVFHGHKLPRAVRLFKVNRVLLSFQPPARKDVNRLFRHKPQSAIFLLPVLLFSEIIALQEQYCLPQPCFLGDKRLALLYYFRLPAYKPLTHADSTTYQFVQFFLHFL